MSGGSQSTSGVQQQFVDPYAYSMMYGPGAVQPIYGKKGRIKNQAEVDAARAGMQANFGTGGLLGTATDLYNSQGPAQWYGGPNTYAPTQENPTADAGTVPGSQVPGNTTYNPFNPMQNTAIGQAGRYLGSPESLAGYDALNSAGNWMMDSGNAPGPIDFGAVMKSVGDTLPGGQYTGGSTDKGEFAWGGPPQISDINPWAIPNVAGASAGGTGVNYQKAARDVLSGEVNNPYLQQMADDQTRRSMRTFNEQILPGLSTGAQAAGQYGGSANAKIYANAGRDLGSDIHGANIGLFGNAYESAQGRKAQMAGQMAGYDTQRDIASSTNQMQADIANQRMALEREMANRDFQLQAGDLGLRGATAKGNYDLGYSNLDLGFAGLNNDASLARYGLGLDAARAQGDYGLGRYGALGNSIAAGAGMRADAAGIPLNNMQSLFGLGSLTQGDIQSQLDAARSRWDFGQQAPWDAANRYASLVFPGAGFGGAQTSNQTTSSQLGAGQIIGGAAMMGMGALGGGGMFGATGAFGQGGRWGG